MRSAAVLRGLASVRFNTVTLAEPPKASLLAHAKGGPLPPRRALVVLLNTPSPDVHEIVVDLGAGEADAAAVASWAVLDAASLGGQPPATPDDCLQAEAIARNDPGVAALLAERGVALEHLFLDPCVSSSQRSLALSSVHSVQLMRAAVPGGLCTTCPSGRAGA